MGHIAAETVNALGRPELEDVENLQPCGRDGVKMGTAVPRVDAVVEFDGLVPVVTVGRCSVAVVAGSTGGKFVVSLFALTQVNSIGRKFLTGNIVEIVFRVKEHHGIVAFAKILNTCGFAVALIFARYMVGHEVDDNLETHLVGAVDKGLKLRHTVIDFDCHVGAHVIVVTDGIGRSGIAFNHMWIARRDAVTRIVGGGGMLNDASIPYVRGTQRLDGSQCGFVNFIEFATTVLPDCAIGHAVFIEIGKPPRHQLVDNRFFVPFHATKVVKKNIESYFLGYYVYFCVADR